MNRDFFCCESTDVIRIILTITTMATLKLTYPENIQPDQEEERR